MSWISPRTSGATPPYLALAGSVLEVTELQLLAQPATRRRAQHAEHATLRCRDMRHRLRVATEYVRLEHLAPVAALVRRQLTQCEQGGEKAVVGVLEPARLVAPPVVDQHVVRLER